MLRKSMILLARNRPILATKSNFPKDFDQIAENVLEGIAPPKEIKKRVIQEPIEPIEFQGIDEPVFQENKKPVSIEKVSKPIELTPKFPSKQQPIQKPLVNELYKEESIDLEWFENKVLNTEMEPRWLRQAQVSLKPKSKKQTGPVQLNEIVEILEKESGMNITVIDVGEKCDHMEALVICEGRTNRHVYSLADAVKRMAKHRYQNTNGLPENLQVQGQETDWMVVDLGAFMVHCFTPECRKQMDLEGVWLNEDEFETGIIETKELEPLVP